MELDKKMGDIEKLIRGVEIQVNIKKNRTT